MSDTDPSTTPEPTSEPSANAGPNCAVSTGSALQIAIAGYMADRADLISQIPEVNLYYERDQAKRGWIEQEIERIDKIVARLLKEESAAGPLPSSPNVRDEQCRQ